MKEKKGEKARSAILDKGRRQKKKVVLLGGAHHKVATPPSPSCGQSTSFFCRKIFLCLESPETEKKFIRLESEIFSPPPSPPQLCQIRSLMKWYFRGCVTPNHIG